MNYSQPAYMAQYALFILRGKSSDGCSHPSTLGYKGTKKKEISKVKQRFHDQLRKQKGN